MKDKPLFPQSGDMKAELDKAWLVCRKLDAEANTLWAEVHKHQAEARKLDAEAHKLWAEVQTRFETAARALCGPDVSIEWTDTGCIVAGVMEFLYETSE